MTCIHQATAPARRGDERSRRTFARASLAFALLAGTATAGLTIHQRAAIAQPKPAPYGDPQVAGQVAKAEAVTQRCDKAAARKEIGNLKKTKEILEVSAKSGFAPQAVADDAKKLGDDIARLERFLNLCSDTNKVAGPNGTTYGFLGPTIAKEAGKYIDDAQRAARACDRDLYKAVIKALHDAIEANRKAFLAEAKGPQDDMAAALSVETLRQLERDLIANEEAAFKHCAPPAKTDPPKADAPKTEPGKVEPAKTDLPKTGTGSSQPNQPPEPPKAPPMSPNVGQAPGMYAPLIFRPGDVLINALLLPTAEFSIALGVRNNTASGHYTGTAQAPGSGSGSETKVNVGAGATIWLPLFNFETGSFINPFEVQLARNAYRPQYAQLAQDLEQRMSDLWFAMGVLSIGGRSDFLYLGEGKKAVLELVRHGPNGAVELTESERTMVSLLLLVRYSFAINLARFGLDGSLELADLRDAQYADTDYAQAPRPRRRANWWPVHIYAGGGPSFVRTKITMTSNQAPGGGVFQSLSETKTDTAWSFVLGAQTAACRNCIFGRPLMLGVEGQWTWLPSRTVSITSSTFGFTETGRVDSRSSARVMFTASVPFTFR